MKFSEDCFEKYINPLTILASIIIIITLICLHMVFPRLESLFWPLILVVSVFLAINLMIYYVILKNRQKAKKRIVPTKTLKTHTVNLYPNNNYRQSINRLTNRAKKIDSFASKNNTYSFGQIETEPYNLPV